MSLIIGATYTCLSMCLSITGCMQKRKGFWPHVLKKVDYATAAAARILVTARILILLICMNAVKVPKERLMKVGL